MILTQAHLAFWNRKRQPGWASRLDRLPPATIDQCVNDHAKKLGKPDQRHHAESICFLIRCVGGRREDVLNYLDHLVTRPGTAIRPQRRAGYAKKWARRIRKNRKAERGELLEV